MSLCVLMLAWALLSCSSIGKQTEEEVAAGSAISGAQWASSSTISPDMVAIAEAYTLYCYGQLFGLYGELDKSLEEYKKAGERIPESGYIDLEKARVYIGQDNLSEAISSLDSAIEKSPGLAEAYVLRGDAHRMLLSVPDAVRDYRRGAELGYEETTLRFTVAELLVMIKQYDEAIAELNKVIELEPSSLRANFTLGRLYLSIGEPIKAIPCLEKVAESRPDDARTMTLLLEAYYQGGRYEDGIVLGRKMVAESPDNVQLRFLLAMSLERQGKMDEAITQLERAIELEPNFAAALNYLGYIYIDKDMELQKGVSLVKAALMIEPHNSAFLDSLGWGLYKLGRIGDAIEQLERAIAGLKDPSSEPVICAHLALAYNRAGRLKDAKQYISIATSKEADDPEVHRLMSELSQSVEQPAQLPDDTTLH